MEELYAFEEIYQECEEEQYNSFLKSISSTANFQDDTWFCDKRDQSKGVENFKVKLYFAKVPENYKTMVKYFVILRLLDGVSVTTSKHSIYMVSNFLGFLGNTPLNNVNFSTVNEFKQYLQKQNFVASTQSKYFSTLSMFFRKMNGYEGMEVKNPFHNQRIAYDRLIESKYIPEFVAKQLDIAFMDENIPITLRTIYWVLRLVPSRISEVLAMEINCLKSFDDHFVLIIPTFKQNGGYKEAIPRIIHIEEDGIGAYLIELIRNQQEEARSVQERLPKENVNALFAYQSFRYEEASFLKKNIIWWQHRHLCPINLKTFAKFIRLRM